MVSNTKTMTICSFMCSFFKMLYEYVYVYVVSNDVVYDFKIKWIDIKEICDKKMCRDFFFVTRNCCDFINISRVVNMESSLINRVIISRIKCNKDTIYLGGDFDWL